MVIKKINELALLSVLAFFALGQIPALVISIAQSKGVMFQLIDVSVAAFVVSAFLIDAGLINKLKKSQILPYLLILALGYALSLLNGSSSVVGVFYLLRLSMYLVFGFTLYKTKPLKREEVVKVLTFLAGIIVVSGLFQYFLIPDLRALYSLGWDDHYFRLVGACFDPTFTGILLVLSLLYVFMKLKAGRLKYLLLSGLFISLLFTYPRASFLALFVGIVFLLVGKSKSFLKFLIFVAIFAGCVLLLPRPASEGVKLERTFSILLRAENYNETIKIWSTSPIFGVGYNNICKARQIISPNIVNNFPSHSCSGADNSFLLILATTGVVGLGLFARGVAALYKRIDKRDRILSVALAASLATHAFTSNSLLYPWIMVWIAFYLSSLTLKE